MDMNDGLQKNHMIKRNGLSISIPPLEGDDREVKDGKD